MVIDHLSFPATQSALQVHDVIIKVNEGRPRDLEHFVKLSQRSQEDMVLYVMRRSSNRAVPSKRSLQSRRVVDLKKLMKPLGVSTKDFTGKKKAAMVTLCWSKQMSLEIAKDHLIDVVVNDKNRSGTTIDTFKSTCGGTNCWKLLYVHALHSCIEDGTLKKSKQGRYKLKT